MSANLSQKKCIPCRGGVPPLTGEDLKPLLAQLEDDWSIVAEHHLERVFRFADFRGALAFTNQVGELAEREQHHPDIRLAWGKVKLRIWTHKIDGLTESDFILAAKVDALPGRLGPQRS